MKKVFRDLWLAVALIAGASLLLLLTDLDQRSGQPSASKLSFEGNLMPDLKENRDSGSVVTLDFRELMASGKQPGAAELASAGIFRNLHLLKGRALRIIMITLVDNLILEEAQKGVEIGLQESGLVKGVDYHLRKLSAQGEISQLPSMMDAAIREKPDLIITVTTPALMAAIKRVKDIPVVFTVASEPEKLRLFTRGNRPGNICGVHDDPPVDQVLTMARSHNPTLKAVGIVYDAAQINSLISVEKLREAGKAQKIQVLEATSSSVPELGMATQSLIQRGAEAVIISADNLAYTGFPLIRKTTRNAGIPLYTTDLELVKQGSDGGVGVSFLEWGKQSGRIAARVLAGAPPSAFPPIGMKDYRRIDTRPGKAKIPRSPYKLRIVHYMETESAERCHDGLIDGLKKSGLKEGRDYELKVYNAQGDMSTLSGIMTTIKADRADLLMVISTPTLQAAIRQVGEGTRMVFTGVGDAVKAGAGKSETDHLPYVTGITTRSPFDEMARLIKESLPGVKQVGTLFTPAEINSVLYKDWFAEALSRHGISLVATPVTSSADIPQSADEMCRNDIQMVCQVADNMTRPGFGLIARKASEKGLPVFVFDSDQMASGGAVCVSRDYYDAGLEAAEKAVKVLNGESPADIPFSNTRSVKLLYNPGLIKQYGLSVPASFRQKARVYLPE